MTIAKSAHGLQRQPPPPSLDGVRSDAILDLVRRRGRLALDAQAYQELELRGCRPDKADELVDRLVEAGRLSLSFRRGVVMVKPAGREVARL